MCDKDMKNNKAIKFGAELSDMHAPEELVQKTLAAMHAENERLARADGISGTRPGRKLPQYWGAYLAAACLLVMVGLGARLLPGGEVAVGTLDVSSLPETTLLQRGDIMQEEAEAFLAENDISLDTLVPGYTLIFTELQSGASVQGEMRNMVTATYSAQDDVLTVTVADFETILYQAMEGFDATRVGQGIEARFARELDEGAVYASWQAGNVFFTAHSTQLDPSAFAALVGNIIGS